jgi:pSer/pThr/pTyr-binding forkhead associated (FHA) protein
VDEIDNYVTIARSSGYEAFIKAFDCLFLIRAPVEPKKKSADDALNARANFRTRAAKVDPAELDAATEAGRPPTWRIARVKKREGNAASHQLSVGRVPSCDVFLGFPSVSKRHATFLVSGGKQLQLSDEGSTNGTWRNGVRLEQGKPIPVYVGDTLRFGGVEARLVDASRLYDVIVGIPAK